MSKYAYESDKHNPPPGLQIQLIDVTWSRDDAIITISGGTQPVVPGTIIHFHSSNYPEWDGQSALVDQFGRWSMWELFFDGSVEMECHNVTGTVGPQISIRIGG